VNYLWNGGATPSNASNSFSVPGTYTVTVSTNNGCTATSSVVITQDTVAPLPGIINITGLTALNCNSKMINVQAIGGRYYHWNGGSSPDTDSNSFIVPGTYIVTVTGFNGCIATTDIVITEVEPLVLSLVNAVADHCGLGIGEATVSASGGNGNYAYSWNTNPAQSGATANHLESGSYQVMVSDGECRDTLSIKIVEVSGPTAAFEAIPKKASISNPEIRFLNQSSNANGFLWSFGDGEIGADENPVHVYTESGDYVVLLEVVDDYGCVDSVSHSVMIFDNLKIYIPNSFTPNGDGVNDEFKPIGKGYSDEGYNLTIYNRWGQRVFSSSSFEKGWDGKIDGIKMNVNAVFVYIIDVYDINGKEYRFMGQITMLGSKSLGEE
jgi:gliding motility-associated-like protein